MTPGPAGGSVGWADGADVGPGDGTVPAPVAGEVGLAAGVAVITAATGAGSAVAAAPATSPTGDTIAGRTAWARTAVTPTSAASPMTLMTRRPRPRPRSRSSSGRGRLARGPGVRDDGGGGTGDVYHRARSPASPAGNGCMKSGICVWFSHAPPHLLRGVEEEALAALPGGTGPGALDGASDTTNRGLQGTETPGAAAPRR